MRARRISVITAALVLFVAVPAFAAYTGTYAPSQAVVPQQLPTVSSFTCSANGLGGTVTLNWSGSNAATTDPYGGTVIDGYRIERSDNNGPFNLRSSPGLAATSATDSGSFGALNLNDKITYQIRTRRSNWVSAPSSTVSGRVTAVIVVLVSCPAP